MCLVCPISNIVGLFVEEKEEKDDKEGFHLESSSLTLPCFNCNDSDLIREVRDVFEE